MIMAIFFLINWKFLSYKLKSNFVSPEVVIKSGLISPSFRQ